MDAQAARPAVLPWSPVAIPEALAAPLPFASSEPLAGPSAMPPAQSTSIAAATPARCKAEQASTGPAAITQASGTPDGTAPLLSDARYLGSTALSPEGAQPLEASPWAPLPVGRPPRTTAQEKVFRFYLGHLSPEMQKAALRAEVPTVTEAFQMYHELKSKGFKDDFFDNVQKTAPTTGPNWVRSSGNKVEVGARIWTSLVGEQPFEQVDFLEIQEALNLMWRIPRDHGRGPKWCTSGGYRKLIERADAKEAEEAERATAALVKRGNATKADIESATFKHKVKRFRTDNYLKHARLPNAVGRMLMALKIIHSNPFSTCTWTDEEEKELRKNEETRARITWDGRLYDLYRTPVFQGEVEEVGDPLFWAPLFARHQGCRMEEILQLGPDDFVTDEGIPYFSIRNIEGNRVNSS